MADKRITDVDFIESLDGSESFFINQNSTLKQVNKGNAFKDTIWNVNNGGTGATDAATARENLGAQTKNIYDTITLSSSGWFDNKQTVSVRGVTEDNKIFTSPAVTNYFDYSEYGIYCSAQNIGELTFTCDSVPRDSIAVNVAVFE